MESVSSLVIAPDLRRIHLIIEFYSKILPKTSLNFQRLCEGQSINDKEHSYKGSYFNRCKANTFFQGGQSLDNQDQSIFGDTFEDETNCVSHNMPGVLGMTNRGSKHTNCRQFYITLRPIKEFDGKFVAFG